MKKYYLMLLLSLFVCMTLSAQTSSITKTWSANRRFYIKSIPYDDLVGSLKGIALVYDTHNKLLYTIQRGFNDVREFGNYVALSNDGNTVAFIIRASADEKTNGLQSVCIYLKGKLVKSFTQKQITGCDPENEKCILTYDNSNTVIDFMKSQLFTKNSHKVYNANVSTEEIFLCNHAIAQIDNRIYITDPLKKVHIIDMDKADTAGTIPFAKVYPHLKKQVNDSLTTFQYFEVPYCHTKSAFPNLLNGDTTSEVLANILGLKTVYVQGPDFGKYRQYAVNIEAYISRDGTIDIQKIDVDKKLPQDTIIAFTKSHHYDASFFPAGIDKWYFRYFFCSFRNKSDKQALLEKQQLDSVKLVERQHRMTMDTINGIYIPRNLEECFIGLDKLLSAANKKEMMAQKDAGGMMLYHFTLGTWMRNNWGLWGGSRLIAYFKDHGEKGWVIAGKESDPDPEGLSSIILTSYYKWLKGDKNAAKEWEDEVAIKALH